MNDILVAIDGNSLINRAYYAIQKPMITKQGLYTHGVYGFLNMLTKIKRDHDPAYIITAFDKKAPTFRHLEYDQYKAGRKKMPDELAMQLPLLKEVLDAMHIKMIEIEGFEADDIIGTIAKKAEEEGLCTVIITGDKDELQLATEQTKVILTKKGISEFEVYDAAAMEEKYGFSAAQFIDYKGMMGDPSDNIPGIPGVGEKTAMTLMHQFGSIENMLLRTDEIKNEKLRAKVEEHAQLAMMSKRLATICTEVPIDVVFDECRTIEPDYDLLIELYKKLEFNNFLSRLKRVAPTAEAFKTSLRTEKVVLPEAQRHVVRTAEEFDSIAEHFSERVVLKVFHDKNHKGKAGIYGISLLSGDQYCYIPISDNLPIIRKVTDFLKERGPGIFGHLLQEDYYALLSFCFLEEGIHGLAQEKGYIFSTAFDTAIAEYLLEPARNAYVLRTMALEYLQKEIPDENEFLSANVQMDLFSGSNTAYEEYGLIWCRTVMELSDVLGAKLEQENLSMILDEIELPLIEVLAVMEYHGFSVDKKELRRTGDMLSERIKEITDKIHEQAGEYFNIQSPKQLGIVLFEKLGLPSAKKTKTGYATGADVLEKLSDKHPIIPLILEFRTITKLNSTYVEGLIPLIGFDGKIRAHFNQTVTTTGRISCTEPNLQNIPIRQEIGRALRKAFVSESEEHILVGADYSQIELRVLAHLSQDESLLKAFQSGDDIHRITAAKVFDVPEDEVTLLQRSRAKVVNFGVIYGMSEFGLATDLSITRKEAGRYIEEYFKKYETVKKYLDHLIEQCKNDGYVTTVRERKRWIPEIHSTNYTIRQMSERLAMNTPVQGSAADIIKIAMIKVQRALMKSGLKTKLILQIHDELVLDVPKEELEQATILLKENMESAMDLSVPLEVSLNTGMNWYDLK